MPIPPRSDILPRPMPSEYPPGFIPPPDLLSEPINAPETTASSSSSSLPVAGIRTGSTRRRSASPARAVPNNTGSDMEVDSTFAQPTSPSNNLPQPISLPPQTPRSSHSHRREMADRGTPRASNSARRGIVSDGQGNGNGAENENVDDMKDGVDVDMDLDKTVMPSVPPTTFFPASIPSDLALRSTQPPPPPPPPPSSSAQPTSVPSLVSSSVPQPTSTIPSAAPAPTLTSQPTSATTNPSATATPTVDEYGYHYKQLMKALDVAVRKGMTKWTVQDLRSCFPLLSLSSPSSTTTSSKSAHSIKASPEEIATRRRKFEELHARTAESLRVKTMAHCLQILDHYKVAPALKLLNETVERAKAVPEGVIPADAWRPDLLPKVRVAASNLGLYDGVYARLKEEYTELYATSEELAKSIESKKKRIAAIEGEVRGSVAQLEATVKTFDNFPNEEMVTWMEDILGGLDGGRQADRVLG